MTTLLSCSWTYSAESLKRTYFLGGVMWQGGASTNKLPSRQASTGDDTVNISGSSGRSRRGPSTSSAGCVRTSIILKTHIYLVADLIDRTCGLTHLHGWHVCVIEESRYLQYVRTYPVLNRRNTMDDGEMTNFNNRIYPWWVT